MTVYELDSGVHFIEPGDEGLQPWPLTPRAAFSLLPEGFSIAELPDQCPALTEFTFDPDSTPEARPVKVALGYVSQEAKDSVYAEMAARLAGMLQHWHFLQ